MSDRELTPSDHRLTIQTLLVAQYEQITITKDDFPKHIVTGPRLTAALLWAINQTQEPAPPPGGWPKEFRSAEGAIRFLEQAMDPEMIHSPSACVAALEWALPILRRAACVAACEEPAMIARNDTLTVGKLREQSALDNAATNVKVLVVDGPTGKIIECLSAIRCYPDTTDERGNLVSTFKIIVERSPKNMPAQR